MSSVGVWPSGQRQQGAAGGAEVRDSDAVRTPSGHSATPYPCYSALPGYWSDAEFTGMVPLVQEAVAARRQLATTGVAGRPPVGRLV